MLWGQRGVRFRRLALNFAQKWRRDGAWSALRRSAEWLGERLRGHTSGDSRGQAFDHEFDIDTGGLIPLWQLSIDSPHMAEGVRYQACDPDWIRHCIESLAINYGDFVFVDLGSGKGRALLVASEYPFRSVVGVEFSPELNAIAVDNIRKCRNLHRRCADVSSVCCDVVFWKMPARNTVFFLYNPFGECVLRRVLEALRASLKLCERCIYIVYCNPVHAAVLDSQSFLERLDLPTVAAVYRHVPNARPKGNFGDAGRRSRRD